ncbi:cytochrome C biosynthesis protein [Flavobacterium sp. CYK-4]|uniref:tetratricopeptide repeat protein n=1 Tax=Flavobacterium lotistagni TaxID=2709660 RepID=UPI00140AEFD7|nr:tetratricopeptide repeat protein [Flavobacterium lotistagni]NHM07885.1 cytochrome C biosynthesis protein [Flavobacterium lotistagni]
MKKSWLAFSMVILFPLAVFAQAEPDAIGLADDQFQNAFYESLLQKGIENYDRAVTALEKCQKLQPDNAVVYFEMGKNYLPQKKYKEAYVSFEKASKIDPKNMWCWVGMYDVCYETKDYNQAIIIVNKLIEFKKDYKEDLVSLYMNTQQFDKALDLINELNSKVGTTEMRENYKRQILSVAQYQTSEKDNLLEQIKKYPKEESNYIALIFLYSESNQEEKAMEIAEQLQREIPTSDWAQVSLFKFHLNNNDGKNAVAAMNKVFQSPKIDNKIKHRMLNEFLIFVKDKPEYDADLEKAISYFADDKQVQVAKEIGKFYHNKKNWNNALKYYDLQLKSHPEDMETIVLQLQAYTENQQFDVLAKKATDWVELYPSQPQLYYYAGLGYNQLKNYKKAKEFLEMGLDYLVDDLALEVNFNIQLGEAAAGLGDLKKKESYFLKAEKLLKGKKS